mgnify:CR=1 FL=1
MHHSGPLVERAELTENLYNILEKKVPEDSDGIKRAYVDVDIVDESEFAVDIVTSTGDECYYGVDPVTVATMNDPFPLMSRKQDLFDGYQDNIERTLLRQALRRIVDEV